MAQKLKDVTHEREPLNERWERECWEIREAILQVNVTHLSRESGISMTTLFGIRAGTRTPSPFTIDAIWAGLRRLGVEL